MSDSETASRPRFGDPLPIRASPETLSCFVRRRSASAMTLAAPGPGPEALAELLAIAARAPDHGKLNPWRFIVLSGEDKAAFVAGLERIAAEQSNPKKAAAKLGKIRVPPVTVAVISHVVEGDITEWEQVLSAGAVCTLMIVAAQAMGFGANWITDWYAYDADALRLLGAAPGERVAGFIHLGTPTEPPLERLRPDMTTIARTWRG
jgi:nitroreductase